MKNILKLKYGIHINHKALIPLMRTNQLQAVIRRAKPKYISSKSPIVADNQLDRDFKADKPYSKLVTDITYIPIPNSMVYLSAVIDLFNGEIVSHKISTCLDTSLSVDVIKELLTKQNLTNTLIHSDQGIHYTNHQYHNLLKDNHMIQSMSRRGNCWDNAMAENFFGHFKCECVKLMKKAMKTFDAVFEIVEEYIYFYNNERAQERLGYRTPKSFLEQRVSA